MPSPAMPQLAKLAFQAFKDPLFLQPVGEPYKVFLNPESVAHKLGNKYVQPEPEGAAAPYAQFEAASQDTLSFTLTLDGTRPLDGPLREVDTELRTLRNLLYKYQGDVHHPYFVQIVWGTLCFNGVLTSFDTSYTLFRPDGSPLRAKLTLAFLGYTDMTLRELKARKSSPDLTHRRVVQAGDTLPQLCYHIYGDARHYLLVARANHLRNLTRLRPGTVLFFPPLR